MTLHSLPGYISTLYLIEYAHGLLLFDSGCLCDVQKIEHYVTQQLNKKMTDIKLIAITHSHPDHIGGAELLQRKWNIPIAANLKALDWYAGTSGKVMYLVDIILTYYVAYKLKRKLNTNLFFKKAFKIDFPLAEMASLPHFSDWKVISTLGHTDSDISFYNETEKLCYVADTLIKLKKGFSRPYPIHHPVEYRQSLKKLAQLPIQKFLLAHSGVHRIETSEIVRVMATVPDSPRTHLSLLPIMLKKLFFKKLRNNR
jgi:glyoxylase-like metal-dependent hydrolase (beta-lactamase superfamily II)